MASKHFIIYYKNGTGTYVVTEPRPWARENRAFFPNYDFTNNHPTTEVVENFLIQNYNFRRSIYQENEIVIILNIDKNFNL
jgi:hypothetical protein